MNERSLAHVHFLGICGYAVGGAALIAHQLGYRVTGSDEDAYPPMSTTLTNAAIDWVNFHDPATLHRWGIPDLVVVGGQVREDNPELSAARQQGIRVLSEAEFYRELTDDRQRLAVCGTHGKTTTATLLAYMLETSGLQPGFRLGTTARDFNASARMGEGPPFVFEGDEYITAAWDSRPKFLHIDPQGVCITRLEHDHPDVFPTFNGYRAPFVELIRSIPKDGLVVLCADDANCVGLARYAQARVVTYGENPNSDWRFYDVTSNGRTQSFSIHSPGGEIRLPALTIPGRHNCANATGALILAQYGGASMDACIKACGTFRGPSRRFDILGEVDGATVVDDYAHHPTEVAATISAAQQRFPSGRLLVVYVPHTYSRTLTLIDDYAHCFMGADVVILGPIEPARERHLAHTVNSHDVAQRIGPPTETLVVDNAESAIAAVQKRVHSGDVVLCMSVRGFDDIASRMVEALHAVH